MDTLVVEPFWTDVPAFFGLTLAELQACMDPRAWIEFEHGTIDEAEYLRRFFADRRTFDHAAFVDCVRRAYRWVPGMRELLAELGRGPRPVHALSNYPSWWRMLDDELHLSRHLAWTFVSCATGVRKPAPRAFRLPTETLGVPAGEILFVDDRDENVRAARAEGLDAVHFTDADALRRELLARGVL